MSNKKNLEDTSSKIRPVQLDANLPAFSTPKQQIRAMMEIGPLSYAELDAFKIIHPGTKDIKSLNAFRELRTKLIQKAGKNNFSVMVSSLAPEGGGTYVSENLAAAIALDFEKTSLLIDCNLTSNTSSNLTPAAVEYGLSDYLDDNTLSASDIIHASGIPRLRVIPVGNHKSARPELFSSDRMEELLKELKNRYNERYIILDAPPINFSPDARVLSDLCDFTVLVVPYGRVTKLQITAGINSIPTNKLAGLIFNN